ncbi:hypothetical protein X797_007896 [Metarhizium robertsii]|uniref:Uncharacterized protein n=1 Tax=Metarhizium robertsii TaxID=568076 RepID=A0A0A1URP8_9HYPO|nr:hypothetical protein X797_007896 [Metarhizium robertsii]
MHGVIKVVWRWPCIQPTLWPFAARGRPHDALWLTGQVEIPSARVTTVRTSLLFGAEYTVRMQRLTNSYGTWLDGSQGIGLETQRDGWSNVDEKGSTETRRQRILGREALSRRMASTLPSPWTEESDD